MSTADDVARYVLDRHAMTAMKMQKLVYYAQAWTLARTGEPLFDEPIEAWVNGPVVRALYDQHRGQFSLLWRDVCQVGSTRFPRWVSRFCQTR